MCEGMRWLRDEQKFEDDKMRNHGDVRMERRRDEENIAFQ